MRRAGSVAATDRPLPSPFDDVDDDDDDDDESSPPSMRPTLFIQPLSGFPTDLEMITSLLLFQPPPTPLLPCTRATASPPLFTASHFCTHSAFSFSSVSDVPRTLIQVPIRLRFGSGPAPNLTMYVIFRFVRTPENACDSVNGLD